mgnify:CR=1 FL=1
MIQTARLTLRRATWDDLDATHRLFSNPVVMRYWSRPEHETLDETKAWLGFLVQNRHPANCVRQKPTYLSKPDSFLKHPPH